MASIQERTNGRWAVRWRDGQGRQQWRTFATRQEAERHLAHGAEGDQGVKVTTFTTYADEWTARQLWRPGTQAQVRCYMTRYLVPAFGHQDLAAIRTADVQVLVRQLSDRLAPATVRLIIAHLRSLFNEAVRDEVVSTNPVRHLRLPRQPRVMVRPPTVAQVSALRLALPERQRTLVDLAAGTGMRQGECLGLTQDRIDFDSLTITVDRQLAQPPIPGSLFGPPKTDSSVRRVPISTRLAEVLHARPETYGLGPHGLLFTGDRGEPLNRRAVSAAWLPAARAANLPDRTGMHCLRHFYASLLIRAGCSVKVVQARLGHATAKETLDTYAHLWPDDEVQTRKALEALII